MASPEPHSRAPGVFLVRLALPNGKASCPILASSQLPRKVMLSTGGAELEQLTRAAKTVIGLRIFFRELKQPQIVSGPTVIFTDAQAVLDGTHCRKVSKDSKWVGVNLAMIHQAEDDMIITTKKCPTEDNVADILTKPLTGAQFTRAQRMIQGLPPL